MTAKPEPRIDKSGTGIEADTLWAGMAEIFARFAPENLTLLAKRDDLQAKIDARARRARSPAGRRQGLSGIPARRWLSG